MLGTSDHGFQQPKCCHWPCGVQGFKPLKQQKWWEFGNKHENTRLVIGQKNADLYAQQTVRVKRQMKGTYTSIVHRQDSSPKHLDHWGSLRGTVPRMDTTRLPGQEAYRVEHLLRFPEAGWALNPWNIGRSFLDHPIARWKENNNVKPTAIVRSCIRVPCNKSNSFS
jgi:hypothetical protein